MALIKQMTSSGTDEWRTPLWLFRWLDNTLHFTLDAAATPENALCKKYFTKEQDALTQSWAGEKVFCNPPYSRPNLYSFALKALNEAYASCPYVALLIPVRTATKAWHEVIFPYATWILFISRRLHFSNAEKNAPFGSAVVIFCALRGRHDPCLFDLKMGVSSGDRITYAALRDVQRYWEGR